MPRMPRSAAGLILAFLYDGHALAGQYKFYTIEVGGDAADFAFPQGIDGRGDVVGYVEKIGLPAFVWSKNRVTLVYGSDPNCFQTTLSGINNQGVAVGQYYTDNNDKWVAFTYNLTTGAQSIIGSKSGVDYYGDAISNTGEIAGHIGLRKSTAFVDHGGKFKQFKAPTFTRTQPYSINHLGTVVGQAFDGPVGHPTQQDSFIRSRGGATTIFSVPGSTATYALGINDESVIWGYYSDQTSWHGFTASSGIYTILDYPGASSTFVTGASKSGIVAGSTTFGSASGPSFVLVNGTYYPIAVPGATTTHINLMGEDGTIAGTYTSSDENTHGFVGVCAPADQPCTQ